MLLVEICGAESDKFHLRICRIQSQRHLLSTVDVTLNTINSCACSYIQNRDSYFYFLQYLKLVDQVRNY
jgi:hypothetical protein